jgi:FAD/FMN-containing dehydrogenase
VGAGVRLSALNNELRPHGMFLPIDLGADPMIGGMIGTNTAGARFLRYGDMRRHVLGLEVVLADRDGTVLDFTSALRKNNTGIDFKQLFIGTGGAFGVVTQAALDVQPLPQQSATALVIPADATTAPFALLRLLEEHAGDCLSAFEGISANAMLAAITHVKSQANPFGAMVPDYAILIELAAGGAVGDLEDRLTRLLEHATEQSLVTDAVIGKGEQLWTLRHSISPALRLAGHVLGFDLAFDRDRVLAFRSAMTEELARSFPEYRVCDFGHLGDGGVHFSLLRSRDSGSIERDAAITDYVFDAAVTRFGGSFSGEHGIGRANQRIYDRYTPPLHQQLASGLSLLFGVGNQGALRFGPARSELNSSRIHA